jgi:predicted DNA-binding transcriptional regulator AlpA
VEAAAVGRYTDRSTNSPKHGKEGARQQLQTPPPRLGYSIAEFCAALGISQACYYELKKVGRTPREMELGTRRIISIEEAIRWCAEQTAGSNPGESGS